MINEYGRRSGSGNCDNGGTGDTHTPRAPGRSTLTSRIQRRAAADVTAPVSALTATPAPAAPAPDASEPFIDPYAIHLLDHSAPVQRMQPQAAVTIDAPKEVEESRATLDVAPRDGREGTSKLLTPPQLATARRRNARHHHRLRFDVGAFGGASPDSNDFALGVAKYQASTGGALGVDGIAGPQTCKHKGCVPNSHAAAHEAAHEDDESAGEEDSLESTIGRRDAVGAADRAQPSAIDQPKADSLENQRDTLPIQARADGPLALDAEQVHAHAAAGVQGAGGPMPHAAQIKASFGAHAPVVDGIQAHVGGAAADASKAIGAEAYATGNAVAFRAAPDIFTAAHEAAHVVQQQAGVQLLGGVGEVGDEYEQNADAVAAKVGNGESAERLLAPDASALQLPRGAATGLAGAIQRSPASTSGGSAAGSLAESLKASFHDDMKEQCDGKGPDDGCVLDGEDRRRLGARIDGNINAAQDNFSSALLHAKIDRLTAAPTIWESMAGVCVEIVMLALSEGVGQAVAGLAALQLSTKAIQATARLVNHKEEVVQAFALAANGLQIPAGLAAAGSSAGGEVDFLDLLKEMPAQWAESFRMTYPGVVSDLGRMLLLHYTSPSRVLTVSHFAGRINALVARWQSQVNEIGQDHSGRMRRLESVAWVNPRMGGTPRLARVVREHAGLGAGGVRDFRQWVDADMVPLALAKWQEDQPGMGIEWVTIDSFENPPPDGEEWDREASAMKVNDEEGASPERGFSNEAPAPKAGP